MKKGFILALSFILLTVFASCGGGKSVKDDSTSGSSKKSSQQNRGQETGYATIFDNAYIIIITVNGNAYMYLSHISVHAENAIYPQSAHSDTNK